MFFKIIGRMRMLRRSPRAKAFGSDSGYESSYGGRRWRKLKGTAAVKLADGTMCHAEVHWYEAHGIGPTEFKIKRILGIQ